jgi:hypothetical protein
MAATPDPDDAHGVRRLSHWLKSVAVVVVAVGALAAPASADDPLYVNWSQYLPSFSSGYEPSDANDCKAGRIQCVDSVIREMTRRFDKLAAECDHDSLFALAYLRTTEEYKRAALTPGFFSDTGFVNHEDAVFARYYFDAYDAWHRGDVAATPPAWRVALAAADAKSAKGNGNVLLGISAHINRDLPFVLAEIGLVKPDGSSRKPDHDKVNDFLNRVAFYEEANRRFDSSINGSGAPGGIHLVVAWREQAWRNAERLVAARTPEERAQVAQSIEDFAHAEAVAIAASNSYLLGETSAGRDAYCVKQQQL